jgi:hypothetical protein
MPTYNGAAYLAQTLASIASQADDQVEVIAVDDGSTDDTLAILRSYTRRLPLRIIARQRIGNWVANTNHGLAEARGRFACFLHQDDLWLRGRLRLLRRLVAVEPEARCYFHASRYVDTNGRWLGTWRPPFRPGCLEPRVAVEHLLVQNFIAVPAPMFPTAVALRSGGMDERLWYTADWDFWLRLAADGKTVYHPKPLTAFRIHPMSQTAQGVARAAEMRQQIEIVLNRHLPSWQLTHPGRTDVEQTARLSLEVNHALAACAFGDRPEWLMLARRFFGLGPANWRRFFRDSRLVERVVAQVCARLIQPSDGLHFRWPSPRSARACQSPQLASAE